MGSVILVVLKKPHTMRLYSSYTCDRLCQKLTLLNLDGTFIIACVAGGIVGAGNNVLTAGPLEASGVAARRMARRTLTYRLYENRGFLNSPQTSVREKQIGREKYTRQSNVK